jgi:hypothetical protein
MVTFREIKDRVFLVWAIGVVLAAAWVLFQSAEPALTIESQWVSTVYIKDGDDIRPIERADLVGRSGQLATALLQSDHLINLFSPSAPPRGSGSAMVIIDPKREWRFQVSHGVVWLGLGHFDSPWVFARAVVLSLLTPPDRAPSRADDLIASIWTTMHSGGGLVENISPHGSWTDAWTLTQRGLCDDVRGWAVSETVCESESGRSRLIDHRLEIEWARRVVERLSSWERLQLRGSLESHLFSLRSVARHQAGVADVSGLGVRLHFDRWLGDWLQAQSAGGQRRHESLASLGLAGEGERFLAPPRKQAISVSLLEQIPPARAGGASPRPRIEEVIWDQCQEISPSALGLRLAELSVAPNALSFPSECRELTARRLDISIIGKVGERPVVFPSPQEKSL